MSTSADVFARANGRCELCSAEEQLEVYVLPIAPDGLEAESELLLCVECRSQLAGARPLRAEHWYGLKELIWSEHLSIQVLSYHILKRLSSESWAQDLLEQAYLPEEAMVWLAAFPAPAESDAAPAELLVRDSNGAVLQEGDTVTLIKDLEVKGANFTAKRGTLVKNISLSDDPRYVEGKVNGIRIVLVAAYLKKA